MSNTRRNSAETMISALWPRQLNGKMTMCKISSGREMEPTHPVWEQTQGGQCRWEVRRQSNK